MREATGGMLAGTARQLWPHGPTLGSRNIAEARCRMKINVTPNTDQIRFYANSALLACKHLPPEAACEHVIGDMMALLGYLDAFSAGDGVVVVGVGKIECGIRLEVSRRDDQVFDLTDKYAESARNASDLSRKTQIPTFGAVEHVRAHGDGCSAELEVDFEPHSERAL